jgi:hypothetical protein
MFKHNVIRRSLTAAAVVSTARFPSAAQAKFINGGGATPGPAVSGPSAPQAASSHA